MNIKEQIRAEIERRKEELKEAACMYSDAFISGANKALNLISAFLDTLPEQPVEKQEQPMSPKDKFVFPNFLYARTVDNKTIDVSYAPQSLDAVEYVKNNPFEQPVEGLEEEIDNYVYKNGLVNCSEIVPVARHFAEWGAEHLKK